MSMDFPKVKSLLDRFRKLTIITKMCKVSIREDIWKSNTDPFIVAQIEGEQEEEEI